MAAAQMSLEEMVGYFKELDDPRSTINQKHPLVSVVVMGASQLLRLWAVV